MLTIVLQSKRKVKLDEAMKAYWGSGGIAPRILDLGVTM
jgi:hypothetical protein